MSARRAGKGRGGKGGHEPRARLRLRAAEALGLLEGGATQQQIAEALGISQPAVSKLIRRAEERLAADQSHRLDLHRARQTMHLKWIYREAAQAWQASKQESLRRRQRKTDYDGGAGSTVAELVSEARHGDPRYLDEARKALADLRKVWGVDAPDRVSVDTASHFESLSDEALTAELMRCLQLSQPSSPGVEVTPAQSSSPGDPDEKSK